MQHVTILAISIYELCPPIVPNEVGVISLLVKVDSLIQDVFAGEIKFCLLPAGGV